MLEMKEKCASCPIVKGLPQTIEAYLNNWTLTEAEKAVCRSILIGKSLRQISTERKTTVTTVRQQALAIYAKSGLSGRHHLSAHFLKLIFKD